MSNGSRGGIGSTILIVVLMVAMLLLFTFVCGKGSGKGCAGGVLPQDTAINKADLLRSSQIIKPIELKNDTLRVRLLLWKAIPRGEYKLGFRIDQVELIEQRSPKDTTKKYTMRPSEKTTERIPVRLLQATRFFDLNGDLIGTWDMEAFKEKASSIGEFLYKPHEGLEIYSTSGFSPDTVETFVSNDSASAVFVWRDGLGHQRNVRLILEGYNIRLESPDSLSEPEGFLFYCENGLARTEPTDNTETGLYQLYYRDGQKKVQWLDAGGVRRLSEGKKPIEPGPYDWVALRGRYFTSIVLPREPAHGQIKPHETADRRIGLEFKANQSKEFTLYFGPQDYNKLRQMKHNLARIVELGGSSYRWLSIGLLELFKFLKSIFGNYGVAIIIFALLIKLVFLPLSQIQQRSMQKMQVLQPKIQEIQKRYARYKNDPQKQKEQNEEIMRLYRTHGASPFMGCLPLLIQMPVFFGLYAVLRNAIELRGAPFVELFTVFVKNPLNLLGILKIPQGNVTWLADLSQYDPFYIIPVLMGVASVFQSLKTNVDPRQRFTAFIFPILITVVFLNFPSGLQLYWFVFNLLSILELFIFKRGAQIGGTQWRNQRAQEIPSVPSSPKSSQG